MSSQNTMGKKKRCYEEWECESLSFDIMLIPNTTDSQGGCKRKGEEEAAAALCHLHLLTMSGDIVKRYVICFMKCFWECLLHQHCVYNNGLRRACTLACTVYLFGQ